MPHSIEPLSKANSDRGHESIVARTNLPKQNVSYTTTKSNTQSRMTNLERTDQYGGAKMNLPQSYLVHTTTDSNYNGNFAYNGCNYFGNYYSYPNEYDYNHNYF